VKNNRWIFLGILGCLGVMILSYLWVSALMDSLYAFRSPLADHPPAPAQAIGKPLTRRVVLVLVDGLRSDTSLDAAVMPFLNELRAQGASAVMHSRAPSFSAPGYSVLMTGAWPDLSDGPTMNPEDGEMPRTWSQDNLFSAAHRAGLRTAVSGLDWFKGLIPQDAVDTSFYTRGEDAAADREVVDAALPWLTDDYQLILIHIDQVDYAGHHEGGPQSASWAAAATRADGLIEEIASQLDLEQDTLVIFSDHGHIDRGGHGGQEALVLVEPFVLAGAGVQSGDYGDIQMIDLAPTVAALLGTNIPATSQGNVLTDMFTFAAEQRENILSALWRQQETLISAYTNAIRHPVDLTRVRAFTVSIVQEEMSAAKLSRLNAERIPRFILAAILVLLPAWALFQKRGRIVKWLLAGAVVYLVLFNLGYAVIDGRTYSLSSVGGVEDIGMFTVGATASAFLVVWCILIYGLKLNRAAPRQAAETSLALTFVTLYLLALPILWSFALNGLLITWTLPDMASMFIGFLSALQALTVAAIGLFFMGLSALFAFQTQKR
jgi:hypothetical protein